MHNLLFYVKYIATIQFFMLLMGLVLFFFTRESLRCFDRIRQWKTQHIKVILYLMLEKNLQLDKSQKIFFNKNIKAVVTSMLEIEKTHHQEKNWERLKQTLSQELLMVKAKKLAQSSSWLNNYLAVLCYKFGFDIDKDEKAIVSLLKSDNLLVSLNMGRIIFDSPSKKAINAMIDVYSQSRHVQQSLFITVIMHENLKNQKELIQFVLARLKKEKDPYIKSFCYRILNELPVSKGGGQCARNDIDSDNIELKLGAIRYLGISPSSRSHKKLYSLMKDDNFEVRSTIVNLLGITQDNAAIPLLEKALHDPNWWVRINAAKSLHHIGNKGIAVLKKQSPDQDKFAYEAAEKLLLTKIHLSKKKGH